MTRIDFYQIDSAEAPLTFACRLIDKIYHRGHQIHIHTVDAAQSSELDDLLWSFRPDRFIPHGLVANAEDADQQAVTVKISHDAEPVDHKDILVNLSGAVPDFFSRFERVAEVVPFDDDSRAAARDNYKFYKDRGYELNYHKMTGKKASATRKADADR